MDKELRDALMEGITIDVSQAGRILGIGRNAAYEAVKRGDIPSVKIGGRIVVPTAPLRRMLGIDRSEKGQNPAAA